MSLSGIFHTEVMHGHTCYISLGHCMGNPPVIHSKKDQYCKTLMVSLLLAGYNFDRTIERLVEWDASMLMWHHPNALIHSSKTSHLVHWKQEGRQFDNFVVTGVTVSCHCDNLRWHQWWQSCQIDNLLFSMLPSHSSKPLPEPMLIKMHDAMWHQEASMNWRLRYRSWS